NERKRRCGHAAGTANRTTNKTEQFFHFQFLLHGFPIFEPSHLPLLTRDRLPRMWELVKQRLGRWSSLTAVLALMAGLQWWIYKQIKDSELVRDRVKVVPKFTVESKDPEIIISNLPAVDIFVKDV